VPLAVPWFPDRRKDTATVIIVQASPQRRRITLRECRPALDAIYQAEKRRSRFAEEEASRVGLEAEM
jgi:hypothetical protein